MLLPPSIAARSQAACGSSDVLNMNMALDVATGIPGSSWSGPHRVQSRRSSGALDQLMRNMMAQFHDLSLTGRQ